MCGSKVTVGINQRTSDPVNAHLTPVLVYILMLLYMYIAPGHGQTTHWGQMLMSTDSPYHFAHLLQVLKQSLHVFHVFPHVYSPGQGQTNPWGQNFNVNRNFLKRPYQFDHLLQVLKKIPLNSDFIHKIFNVFSHVYSPEAGADNALGTKFWSQQKGFITLTICCKFLKKSLSTLIIYIFLKYFIHVYSPGTRADKPLGSKFWCQQKGLIILTICCKLKKIALNSDFIHTF